MNWSNGFGYCFVLSLVSALKCSSSHLYYRRIAEQYSNVECDMNINCESENIFSLWLLCCVTLIRTIKTNTFISARIFINKMCVSDKIFPGEIFLLNEQEMHQPMELCSNQSNVMERKTNVPFRNAHFLRVKQNTKKTSLSWIEKNLWWNAFWSCEMKWKKNQCQGKLIKSTLKRCTSWSVRKLKVASEKQLENGGPSNSIKLN